MANIKLTDEEKQSLQQARQMNEQITYEFGKLYREKKRLENKESNMQQQVEKFESEFNELLAELQEKYGNGSIDLDKGEFVPDEEK